MIMLLTLAALLLPGTAFAYIGPGPGLGMLGSFLTLLGSALLALLMVLLYPIRLLLRRRRERKEENDKQP